MDKQTRIEKMNAVNDSIDMDTEQSAISEACVVDILPSLPIGKAVGLHHQWDDKREKETTRDYVAACKKIGAAFDRGARRYVISPEMVPRATTILAEEGFLPCVHPSLQK